MVLKGAMAKGKEGKVEPETEVQLVQVMEVEVPGTEVPGKEVLETEVDQEAVARMVVEEETALALVDKSTTSRCRNS